MPTRSADLAHDAPGALELVATPALDLLRVLDHGPPEPGSEQADTRARLERARAEVNALRRRGKLGLTVALLEVAVLDVHEGLLAGQAGEIYLVSWILSGYGRAAEFRRAIGFPASAPVTGFLWARAACCSASWKSRGGSWTCTRW